ncbi:MAG: Clp protease ClpP [Candidatus Azobacteroides sp.]|nr:Clp protease ClpP [Candidatus Azobacteroides sp.]
MKQTGIISIVNKAETSEAVIDIEGIIGIPEWWQFDNDEDRTSTYDRFKKQVDDIRKLSVKKVTVNIRSIGGDTNDAFLIHDSLTQLNADVVTICYGYTASAATIIAQAGKTRRISSNSLYLIHRSATFGWGNINDISELLDSLKKTDDRIASLYSARSGETKEFYEDIMSRADGNGEWFSPDEALQAKLVDEIVKMVQTSNIDTSFIADMKLPAIPENKLIKEEKEIQPDLNTTNQMKVKILNGWKFIQNLFGWDAEEEKEITVDNLQQLNDKCTEMETQNVTQANEIVNLKNENAKKDTEIQNLKDRVSNLEGDLAKAKADPTKTNPKEDPDLIGDNKKTENQKAYEEDIKSFKS